MARFRRFALWEAQRFRIQWYRKRGPSLRKQPPLHLHARQRQLRPATATAATRPSRLRPPQQLRRRPVAPHLAQRHGVVPSVHGRAHQLQLHLRRGTDEQRSVIALSRGCREEPPARRAGGEAAAIRMRGVETAKAAARVRPHRPEAVRKRANTEAVRDGVSQPLQLSELRSGRIDPGNELRQSRGGKPGMRGELTQQRGSR